MMSINKQRVDEIEQNLEHYSVQENMIRRNMNIARSVCNEQGSDDGLRSSNVCAVTDISTRQGETNTLLATRNLGDIYVRTGIEVSARYTPSTTSDTSCICKQDVKNKYGKLFCSFCKRSYHKECLSIDAGQRRDEEYYFACGIDNCNDGKQVLHLKNRGLNPIEASASSFEIPKLKVWGNMENAISCNSAEGKYHSPNKESKTTIRILENANFYSSNPRDSEQTQSSIFRCSNGRENSGNIVVPDIIKIEDINVSDTCEDDTSFKGESSGKGSGSLILPAEDRESKDMFLAVRRKGIAAKEISDISGSDAILLQSGITNISTTMSDNKLDSAPEEEIFVSVAKDIDKADKNTNEKSYYNKSIVLLESMNDGGGGCTMKEMKYKVDMKLSNSGEHGSVSKCGGSEDNVSLYTLLQDADINDFNSSIEYEHNASVLDSDCGSDSHMLYELRNVDKNTMTSDECESITDSAERICTDEDKAVMITIDCNETSDGDSLCLSAVHHDYPIFLSAKRPLGTHLTTSMKEYPKNVVKEVPKKTSSNIKVISVRPKSIGETNVTSSTTMTTSDFKDIELNPKEIKGQASDWNGTIIPDCVEKDSESCLVKKQSKDIPQDRISQGEIVSDISEDTKLSLNNGDPVSDPLACESQSEELPDEGYFSYSLPKIASFNINSNEWERLKSSQSGNSFKRGLWQSSFIKGLKLSNRYCCFMAKGHHVSASRLKKKGRLDRRSLFCALFYCKFIDCPVKAKVEMFNEEEVHVVYTGTMRHKCGEIRARPLRGAERDRLKKLFLEGKKPKEVYKELVAEADPVSMLAGNRDGLAERFGTIRKIEHEAYCEMRKDVNEITKASEFTVDAQEWKRLLKFANCQQFQTDHWQNLCIDGLKESNSACRFTSKYHWVSTKMVPKFFAQFYCRFRSCNLEAYLKMFDDETVHVTYTGTVNHRYDKDFQSTAARNKGSKMPQADSMQQNAGSSTLDLRKPISQKDKDIIDRSDARSGLTGSSLNIVEPQKDNFEDPNLKHSFFTHEIPKTATFSMDAADWKRLRSSQSARSFRKGVWQSIYIKGLKESNKYCCFMARSHSVTTTKAAKVRQKKGPIFRAFFYCKFKDCSVQAKLKMYDENTVHVTYTGSVKHRHGEVRSRPLRGSEKEEVKKQNLQEKTSEVQNSYNSTTSSFPDDYDIENSMHIKTDGYEIKETEKCVHEIPESTTFSMDAEEWSKLLSCQNGQRFTDKTWDCVFLMGLKESNAYCNFSAKHHRISIKSVSGAPRGRIFFAQFYCDFESCNVEAFLEMYEAKVVYVTYVGEVNHNCSRRDHRQPECRSSKENLETPQREKGDKAVELIWDPSLPDASDAIIDQMTKANDFGRPSKYSSESYNDSCQSHQDYAEDFISTESTNIDSKDDACIELGSMRSKTPEEILPAIKEDSKVISNSFYSDDQRIDSLHNTSTDTDIQSEKSFDTSADVDTDILEVQLENEADSQEYFFHSIPRTASFNIASKDWERLKSTQRLHSFKKGSWQDLFIKGLKKSNNCCCFMAKCHNVSISAFKRRKRPIFSALFYCKFKDCTVKARLRMFDPEKVHVTYSGRVKHKRGESRARPIRGTEREELKKLFLQGKNPRDLHEELLASADPLSLAAGNCDGFSANIDIFRCIEYEALKPGKQGTHVVSKTAEFIIAPSSWETLMANKNFDSFQGNWQTVFIQGLLLSNEYCNFVPRHHRINANMMPSFFAEFYCSFKSCNMQAYLEMFDSETVYVTYNGRVNHKRKPKEPRPRLARNKKVTVSSNGIDKSDNDSLQNTQLDVANASRSEIQELDPMSSADNLEKPTGIILEPYNGDISYDQICGNNHTLNKNGDDLHSVEACLDYNEMNSQMREEVVVVIKDRQDGNPQPFYTYGQTKVILDPNSQTETNSEISGDIIEAASLATDPLTCHVEDSELDQTFFIHAIPATATFDLKPGEWQKLKSSQMDRSFKNGSWQSIFVRGLKESNKYCCFMAKGHHVTTAKIRKKSSRRAIFSAVFYCRFKDCTVRATLKMFDDTFVHVSYTGSVKHKHGEVRARPLRGEEREELKKLFLQGRKPRQVYDELVAKADPISVLAGNHDGFGSKRTTFRTIKYQALHKEMKDTPGIQQTAEFRISFEDWRRLMSNRDGQCFLGQWQEIFIQGLRQSNQYCDFVSKYQKLNTNMMPTFFAHFFCCKESCTIEAFLEMFDHEIVYVTYSGSVNHKNKAKNRSKAEAGKKRLKGAGYTEKSIIKSNTCLLQNIEPSSFGGNDAEIRTIVHRMPSTDNLDKSTGIILDSYSSNISYTTQQDRHDGHVMGKNSSDLHSVEAYLDTNEMDPQMREQVVVVIKDKHTTDPQSFYGYGQAKDILGNAAALGETNSEVPTDMINSDTISCHVQDSDIKQSFFIHDIPDTATFQVNPDDWAKLKSTQVGCHFKKGMWQNIFLKGLRESNKYCCFMAKSHRVTAAKLRRKKGSMFRAQFYCKFQDCTVLAALEMHNEEEVLVSYTGSVKHRHGEVRARPVSCSERKEEKKAATSPVKKCKGVYDEIVQSQLWIL